MIWHFLFTLLNMDRLKLIIICLLNANVNYMPQVHHYGSSRNRIWPSDEKRQDLKVNNYNTHDERLLIFHLFFYFFVCLLLQISFFQEPFSKMSSWQTASFTWQGNDNVQLPTCGSRKLAIPRSALSEQILRHFNAQLETQFPSNGWPLLQNEVKTKHVTEAQG